MKFVTGLHVLVFCSLTVHASAQSTFGNLRAEGLPTVYLTDRTGQETMGKLVSFTDSTIVLQLNDATTRTFTADQVSLLERKGDSLKNGAIIGAIFGGVTGILTVGLADCPNPDNRSNCPGTHIAFAMLATGMWAAIGTAIDAVIPGRTRIWPGKPARTAGLTLSISPQERRAFIGWRMN